MPYCSFKVSQWRTTAIKYYHYLQCLQGWHISWENKDKKQRETPLYLRKDMSDKEKRPLWWLLEKPIKYLAWWLSSFKIVLDVPPLQFKLVLHFERCYFSSAKETSIGCTGYAKTTYWKLLWCNIDIYPFYLFIYFYNGTNYSFHDAFIDTKISLKHKQKVKKETEGQSGHHQQRMPVRNKTLLIYLYSFISLTTGFHVRTDGYFLFYGKFLAWGQTSDGTSEEHPFPNIPRMLSEK